MITLVLFDNKYDIRINLKINEKKIKRTEQVPLLDKWHTPQIWAGMSK